MSKFLTLMSLLSAVICSSAFAGVPEECDQNCYEQIAALEGQARTMDSEYGVKAVAVIAMLSPDPVVKLKALDLMATPINRFNGSIRGAAIISTRDIVTTSRDVRVYRKALSLLESPMKAMPGSIRGLAINAIGSIGVLSDSIEVKQYALELLADPQSSMFAAIRSEANRQIQAINSSMRN